MTSCSHVLSFHANPMTLQTFNNTFSGLWGLQLTYCWQDSHLSEARRTRRRSVTYRKQKWTSPKSCSRTCPRRLRTLSRNCSCESQGEFSYEWHDCAINMYVYTVPRTQWNRRQSGNPGLESQKWAGGFDVLNPSHPYNGLEDLMCWTQVTPIMGWRIWCAEPKSLVKWAGVFDMLNPCHPYNGLEDLTCWTQVNPIMGWRIWRA